MKHPVCDSMDIYWHQFLQASEFYQFWTYDLIQGGNFGEDFDLKMEGFEKHSFDQGTKHFG